MVLTLWKNVLRSVLVGMLLVSLVSRAHGEDLPVPEPSSIEARWAALDEILKDRVREARHGKIDQDAWRALQGRLIRFQAEAKRRGDPDLERRVVTARERFELLWTAEDDPAALARRLRALDGKALPSIGPMGAISGRVTRASDGTPLAGIRVIFESIDVYHSALTDEDGRYEEVLPVADYFVGVSDPDGELASQIYDRRDCLHCFDLEDLYGNGDPVRVSADATVTGIDFELLPFAALRGRVTDDRTGEPITEGEVTLRWVRPSGTGTYLSRFVGDDGRFEFDELPPGSYLLKATAPGYQGELYDDILCSATGIQLTGCPEEAATRILVEAGAEIDDLDFALVPKGSLVGRVIDATTGAGIPDISVSFFSGVYQDSGVAITDGDGFYRSPGLGAGPYRLRTRNSSFYVDEVYDDILCAPDCGSFDGEELIVLPEIAGAGPVIDLHPAGTLAGRITRDSDGAPLAGIWVTAEYGRIKLQGLTDENGFYRIQGVFPGDFLVSAESEDHGRQAFDGIPCDAFGCPEGARVSVALGETVSGVDFALDGKGRLAVRTVDGDTGEGIRATLDLFSRDGERLWEYGRSGEGDTLEVELEPGTYFLRASNYFYVPRLYPNRICYLGVCDPTLGEPIEVLPGERLEVVLTLERAGQVEGTAVDRLTGLPLKEVEVRFYDLAGNLVRIVESLDGSFASTLPPGEYRAVITQQSLVPQVHGGGDCPSVEACDLQSGVPITVSIGETTSGVDFSPGASPEPAKYSCPGGNGALCVGGQEQFVRRFSVTAAFRGQDGVEGQAQALRLGRESGYLWFFDEDNPEVLVKVLDGCELNGHFWVFAAGLTNVEVRLKVLDTETLGIREYRNAPGTSFAPIQDTEAFACAGIP